MGLNLKALSTEIASIGTDPVRLLQFMGVLLNPDPTILEKGMNGRGPDLYNEIERDCHAFSVLQKRKMGVVSREWQVEPGGKRAIDRLAAQEVQNQLENLGCDVQTPLVNPLMGFDALCYALLDANLKGYAIGEVMWAQEGKRVIAKEVRMRPARRFAFKYLDNAYGGYELRLLTIENAVWGLEVPARKFLVHTTGSQDGCPYGLGLGSRLYWPTWFKRQSLVFWLQFLEKYANPSPIAKYPLGTPIPEQDRILKAVEDLVNGRGGTVPEGTTVEAFQVNTGASTAAYLDMCGYLDDEMSKCVLGETLTTQIGDVGSQAAATVHDDVRTELARADGKALNCTLRAGLIRWIVELNYPGAAIPTLIRAFEDPIVQCQTAQAWSLIGAMGFTPSLDDVKKNFGDGWERAAPVDPGTLDDKGTLAGRPQKGQETIQAGTRDLAMQSSFAEPGTKEGPEKLASMIEKAVEATGPVLQGMVAQVRKLVDQADSLEDLRDSLLTAFPKLDATAFAEVMAEAMTASSLAGRYDVGKGC